MHKEDPFAGVSVFVTAARSGTSLERGSSSA
jgi:hypothetical protein